jgi:hypothetical protein
MVEDDEKQVVNKYMGAEPLFHHSILLARLQTS